MPYPSNFSDTATSRTLVYIGKVADAFPPDGSFKDPKATDLLKRLMERTLLLARQLKSNGSV
ncbi:MAG: hypothetical protein HY651_10645 [Acidobacteria bacterium]|nr:hypothetical protein [Acidobacteriota bacterium]